MRLCECGCGEATDLAKRTNRSRGVTKGQPQRFLVGHWARTPKAIEQNTRRIVAVSTRQRGSGNPSWKGGRVTRPDGYIERHMPDHPNADLRGYVFEHRLVMAHALGRPLREDEVVHHKDGNRANNSLGNLQLLSQAEHARLHAEERANGHDH